MFPVLTFGKFAKKILFFFSFYVLNVWLFVNVGVKKFKVEKSKTSIAFLYFVLFGFFVLFLYNLICRNVPQWHNVTIEIPLVWVWWIYQRKKMKRIRWRNRIRFSFKISSWNDCSHHKTHHILIVFRLSRRSSTFRILHSIILHIHMRWRFSKWLFFII